ncbi:Hypothetical protein NTJ_08418 [Nesidiocoris tenuis]|nr:Hypothetical protein NTJ_08418 [Nesidiocoris tenuis]
MSRIWCPDKSYRMVQIVISTALIISALSVVDAAPKKNNGPTVLPLPSYVPRACSRNDPNVTECVKRVGTLAIQGVVKGDPKYRIPRLDPMLIEELKVQQGTKQVGLSIICKKCLLYGLPTTEFIQADVDWDKKSCTWGFHVNEINVKGKYNVSGQVLLLPITGSGNAEFNLYDINFKYIYEWEENKIANWTYINVTKSEFPLEVKNMTIKLENLFNGDKLLGENMNRFINDNWAVILKDIKPALSEALASLTTSVLTNMAKVVPFDLMFPEKYDPKAPLP